MAGLRLGPWAPPSEPGLLVGEEVHASCRCFEAQSSPARGRWLLLLWTQLAGKGSASPVLGKLGAPA